MYSHLRHDYFKSYTEERLKKISLHKFGRVNKFMWAIEDLWVLLRKELDPRADWVVPGLEKEKNSGD